MGYNYNAAASVLQGYLQGLERKDAKKQQEFQNQLYEQDRKLRSRDQQLDEQRFEQQVAERQADNARSDAHLNLAQQREARSQEQWAIEQLENEQKNKKREQDLATSSELRELQREHIQKLRRTLIEDHVRKTGAIGPLSKEYQILVSQLDWTDAQLANDQEVDSAAWRFLQGNLMDHVEQDREAAKPAVKASNHRKALRETAAARRQPIAQRMAGLLKQLDGAQREKIATIDGMQPNRWTPEHEAQMQALSTEIQSLSGELSQIDEFNAVATRFAPQVRGQQLDAMTVQDIAAFIEEKMPEASPEEKEQAALQLAASVGWNIGQGVTE